MARRQKIEGIETVRQVFRRMPEESLRRVTNALNQGADEIVAKAEDAVPVGTDPHHVKDTIKASKPEFISGGRRLNTNVAVFVTAGDTKETFQAALRSEFGRRSSGIKGEKGYHKGHSAQPFMFPAYFSVRKRVRRRIKREIKRAAKFFVGQRNKP